MDSAEIKDGGYPAQSLRQIVNVSDLQGRLHGKISELALPTKNYDMGGNMMIQEDGSPSVYSIRQGLLPAASTAVKPIISSTAVPK